MTLSPARDKNHRPGRDGYLAQLDFGDGADVKSPVYQAVGSPLRNVLGLPERLAMRLGWSGLGERVGKTLARFAGVEKSALLWHLTREEPWFENHISTLELRGREAVLKVEKPTPENTGEPGLRTILERHLTPYPQPRPCGSPYLFLSYGPLFHHDLFLGRENPHLVFTYLRF